MKTLSVWKFFPVLALFLIGACASAPDHALSVGGMSDAAYLAASPEAQEREIARLEQDSARLMRLQEARYMAGIPVYIGDAKTGFTISRDSLTGVVAIYPGHDPHGIDGAVSSGMYVTFTDEQGNILFNRGPNGEMAPITLLANVATQDDAGKEAIRGVFGLLTAVGNNVGAAAVSALSTRPCDGCNSGVIIGGVAATAGAVSSSSNTTTVKGRVPVE